MATTAYRSRKRFELINPTNVDYGIVCSIIWYVIRIDHVMVHFKIMDTTVFDPRMVHYKIIDHTIGDLNIVHSNIF